MKFLADEGMDGVAIKMLRGAEHDVVYAAESLSAWKDDDLLRFAAGESRILITRDKDFGELVYNRGMLNFGVILLRIEVFTSLKRAATLMSVIDKYGKELENCFVTIRRHRVSIVALP